jgi:hypothetical protein
MRNTYSIAATILVLARLGAHGQDSAPSSHLLFPANGGAADILVNEVRVPGKAMYTYYETIGWGGSAAGYAGIQEHPSGRNFIFSIWDNALHRAPIRPAYTGHGTTTETFGGEGTGLKSWSFKLPWEAGAWYALAARVWPVGRNTMSGMWVRDGITGKWRHLITMEVSAPDAWFQGSLDAFIEDWQATGTVRREANFRKPWRRKVSGGWDQPVQADYSVNRNDLVAGGRSYNFRRNWDGGKRSDATGEYYYMVSGGAGTVPTTAIPATLAIARSETRPGFAPFGFKSISAKPLGNERVELAWEADSLGSPQFGYAIEVFDNPGFTGQPVLSSEKGGPDQGKDTVALGGKGAGPLYARLTVDDLFDNRIQAPAFRFENGTLAIQSGTAGSVGENGKARRVRLDGKTYPDVPAGRAAAGAHFRVIRR